MAADEICGMDADGRVHQGRHALGKGQALTDEVHTLPISQHHLHLFLASSLPKINVSSSSGSCCMPSTAGEAGWAPGAACRCRVDICRSGGEGAGCGRGGARWLARDLWIASTHTLTFTGPERAWRAMPR